MYTALLFALLLDIMLGLKINVSDSLKASL